MTDPEIAGGNVFLVLRNSFEGPWRRRLTPVKVTQTFPRVLDADCVVVHAFVTVPAQAFNALEAGDLYVDVPAHHASLDVAQ